MTNKWMGLKMRVAVIVRAVNEEACIGEVIRGIRSHADVAVFVVDNGSTDATAQVSRAAGAQVVHESRTGYGYACAAGAAAAGHDFDVLVFMDGDGSNDAGELPLLLQPLERDRADLVLGSRDEDRAEKGALMGHQRLGNILTTTLIRALYGQRLSDLPPFKAIRRSVLESLGMREMTYGWTVEMIVKSAKRGYRMTEVPVRTYRRIGGRSKVSGTLKGTVLAAYYLLTTTLKYTIRD